MQVRLRKTMLLVRRKRSGKSEEARVCLSPKRRRSCQRECVYPEHLEARRSL
jgi:hypothetical protein